MSKSTEKQSIYLSLAAILTDIEAIAKKHKNKDQNFDFRSIDDLYNELHPIFAAHGVVCLPTVDELTYERYTNKKGNDACHTHVKVGYKFIASDGSFVEAKSAGEGIDFSDKGTAKALSMAHKYLLVQTFLVPFAKAVDADYYDPTIDPHEELKQLKEERAKQAVNAAVAAGPGTKIEDARIEEIEAKREDAARAAAAQPASIMRVTSEELASGAPGTPEPPQEPAEAPLHPKPVRSRKDKDNPAPPPTKEAATRVESDAPALPGGEVEQKAPAAKGPPQGPPWFEFVIKPEALSHAKFKDRKVGDLELSDLVLLETNWMKRFEKDIAANAVKSELRDNLKLALEYRRKEAATAKGAKK